MAKRHIADGDHRKSNPEPGRRAAALAALRYIKVATMGGCIWGVARAARGEIAFAVAELQGPDTILGKPAVVCWSGMVAADRVARTLERFPNA